MESTDGLLRGMKAVDTGSPITVPVGDKNLGRIFNLLGQPVDNKPAVEGEERWPIHRPAPSYEEQQSTTEILETGIKVVDLIAPFAKGGKIGLFGGAGVGKTVIIMELINNIAKHTAVFRYSPVQASVHARATICTTRCRNPALSTRLRWFTAR